MIRPKERNYFFSRPAIGENNFCLWTEPGKKIRELAAVVPPKKNFKEQWAYDKEHKKRNEVERFFRRLKRFRRIFTRYDKLDILFAVALFCSSFSLIRLPANLTRKICSIRHASCPETPDCVCHNI